ncbi:hypothetical protein R5R35_005744 [Gryllus longicercus]|uniref:Mitogen-activated protein kinase kinase kinase 4 n=1 Tax=Gryllus longicercus TaxID=2509291 RepID=A0AAN9Z9X3_9ORTH
MADSDWKKRVGIEINFSPESSDDERGSVKSECEADGSMDRLSPRFLDSAEGSLEGMPLTEEDYLNLMTDAYGTTPPRARIRRKERRHREKEEQSGVKKSPKVFYTMRTRRRNTLDSIYLDGLMEKCETNETSHYEEDQYLTESNKRTKRSMKLLRESERDMKLEQVGVRHNSQAPTENEEEEEKTESLPATHPQHGIKVESCNRFMSLTSKPVECQKKILQRKKLVAGQENRLELFNKIAHIIRTGAGEKQSDKLPWRQLSQEEHLWQNELKDLIWLELQAWHADRTLTEQDEYLCKAREKVGTLLDDIMNYKFQSHTPLCPPQQLSAQSSDSGFEGHEECMMGDVGECCPQTGCLSIYCHSCVENQMLALKDVEQLLSRLEKAESLYPSSKAFALHFPLYKSPNFIGRVKAMCLWYNMTKHHRLKLLILGKHFTFLHSKNYNWPALGEEDSGIATDTSAGDVSPRLSRNDSMLKGKSYSKNRKRAVQFDTGSTTSSPSDSNNSNASHVSDGVDVADCLANCFDSRPVSTTAPTCCFSKSDVSCVNPFRKYIEEVLKTKGLRKSLYFLEKLHNHILIKAMLSLSKPEKTLSQDTETLDVNANDSVNTIQDSTTPLDSSQIHDEQEEELKRYGFWSEVAQSLHLPSYRSAFIFLAHIPLDVVYELLQMRLEQKPANPSVLCIRQLMRELKEGLRMAALHRERYLSLIRTTLWDVDEELLKKYEDVSGFDSTCDAVLNLYLEYLQQWVPMVQHERFHKNLLEEEWQFVKSTCMNIPGASTLVGNVFCHIATGMVEAIENYSKTKLKEVMVHKDQENGLDESSTKHDVMLICREFQTLFNELRQKSYKAIFFSRTLVKDLERDDCDESSLDSSLREALEELKSAVLALRFEVASALQSVGVVFRNWNMDHVDDTERQSLNARFREILHLGYKYLFEFHREICRAVTGEARTKLYQGYISFAYQWMDFVKEWCEQGRGSKPRWACQGTEFLMFVTDPIHTCHLTEEEFESFQSAVEKCIAYVIGTASPTIEKRTSSPHIFHGGRGSIEGQRPKSRASSPASRTKSPSYRTSRSMLDTGVSSTVPNTQRSLSANPSFSNDVDVTDDVQDGFTLTVKIPPKDKISRIERVRSAIKNLENDMNNKLLQQELIGSVTDIGSEDRIHIKSRCVTFSWQRGMKIGQGRFGKVYTAVNNETGELLAMKEIQLQPNDHRTIRRVAEELRTFEGITHRSLVRYYGVEIHREEMLIFMEFCAEGTLESLVAATESGLPEPLIRRYTHQLLDAVSCLHRHGVVHRDIKSANIFLTDEGNSLKLGDFGSAVKIKAHTTLPGELQGFVGTQAYMAPEVFMKTNTEGHGRTADIWSVGCVVVEMASGKRPWAEYDSNYQIMFKVGMGETPHAPPTLSEEGHQFLDLCLQHDPRERASAHSLLLHSFVKVDSDDDYSSTLPSVLEDSLKLSSIK